MIWKFSASPAWSRTKSLSSRFASHTKSGTRKPSSPAESSRPAGPPAWATSAHVRSACVGVAANGSCWDSLMTDPPPDPDGARGMPRATPGRADHSREAPAAAPAILPGMSPATRSFAAALLALLAACAARAPGTSAPGRDGPAARADARATGSAPAPTPVPAREPSVYDIPLETLSGTPTTLAEHRGKALLIVNVASQCGLTPQYTGLEELQRTFGPRGFTVIGFPCNQFGAQEPGSADEIRTFCSTQYGVTFPLMAKVEVNGPGRHALYRELTKVADASGAAGDIQWNFEKFLVSADGERVTRFRPRTEPGSLEVVGAIEAALP